MMTYGVIFCFWQPAVLSEQVFADDFGLFWGLAIGMNMPWIVIPPIMTYIGFKEISDIVAVARGKVKKA